MLFASLANFGLLLIAAVTPVLLFFDNLVFVGAIQFFVAINLIIIAAGMRPGEARHVFKLVRIPAVIATIPLLWMLIQLLPLAVGLSRSIWESAASALETPRLLANMTIDPGLTLIAVSYFGAMAGIALLATAVSIDRQRAEKLLLSLGAVAAVISLTLLVNQIGGFNAGNEPGGNYTYAAMMTTSIVGSILFAASMIMTVEKYERRHGPRISLSRPLLPIGVTTAGLLICCFPLIAGDASHAIFVAACGLATIVVIYAVRRLGFGPRTGLAMACVAVIAAAMVIWTRGDHTVTELSLRYVTAANSQELMLDKRILDAVGPTGSGAGTFPGVSTIYGAQGPASLRPATFAAKIAIELGRPALWIIVGLACVQIALFARCAFNRGRDCFYALAAAGVTVAIVLDCFTSEGLANPAVSLLVALTLGLGIGQSIGRDARATP